LRASYRDLLRQAGDVCFVFLDVSRDEIEHRMASRTGHFMGTALVESQFATLERPDAEPGVHVIDATKPFDDVVADACQALFGSAGQGGPPLLVDEGPGFSVRLDR
jgi:gluconokinase